MKYVEILNWLLSLGPKLPLVLAEVQLIVDAALRIRAILGGEELVQGAATDEEAALEAQVIAAAQGENFAGPLQRVLDFIRNNPELIALLLSFLKK